MILLMMVYEAICCYNYSSTHEATFKSGILAHLYVKIGNMGFVGSTTNTVSYALEFS